MKLNRAQIIAAAFIVLDREGLDGLSLRTLAGQLSVQAPSLYWHVRNKGELIALMAATFYEKAALAQSCEHSWQAKLITFGQAMRSALLHHRDSARLCASAHPLDEPEISAVRLETPLVAAGLDRDRALSCQAAVIAYALGWVVYEQSPTLHDHLAHMIDFNASFDAGLYAMVEGFVRLGGVDVTAL
jgi:TetR/AcrR family transcriptional regulator, tetracycline repressor protein